MKPLFSQKFAILTAENPRYGSVEGGNAALEQEMKAKDLKFTPMKGKYGTSENSYLVENPDHQDILSWGKKYGQDSVIVSDGGLHKMVYTNGPHEGLWHEGHSISIYDKEPEDFYSTINLNNKPTHFTIDFDMDTKHGAQMKKSLTKMLKSLFTPKLPLYSEYVESLEKSEKLPHFLKFMGDHPKAQETAQWTDDNLKHRNLAEFAMRHAKTKPEGLNEEEKTHIKHFNDSLHMSEVQKAAGMLTNKHDFHSGINMLKDAEAAYQKRHAAEAPTLVPTEGIKVLDFGDGVAVYHLPLNSDRKNENEAKAMGHCATPHKGGQLWSIRRDHGNGMVEPLVTISHEDGYIGEMKGKHNWKPSDRHHIHIAKLLASDKIKGFVGGGYAPESNFEISDLKEGLRNKLLEHKPSLVQQVYKETLPRGFQGDYSHVPEIKSIFSTNNLEAQKKYLQKFSKDIQKHIEIRRSVAKHPNTHPDILHKLSTDNDKYVRNSVAENPNTHPDILHKLSTDNDEYVRSSVAKHPNTHPDILHKLSTDNDKYVRNSVAENPNTHPDILRQLSNDNKYYVRSLVAKNPNTHPDILHKLSTDNDNAVRSSVAKRPNTHPDILHKLSTDSSEYVRSSVAKHPNTHPDILHKLSTDNDKYVRSSVAENSNTHPDILRQLSTDSSEYVRSSVAKNPNTHPDILHKLSTDNYDDYDAVRSSVAKHPNTHPDILHKLSTDNNYAVRSSVAENSNTHPDILRQLSTDSSEYVRNSVAKNPQFKNLPLEIKQNIRPLINTNIQKIIAMINDGERNPDAARKATEELRNRRKEKYDRILSPEGNLSDIQHLSESHDEDISKRAREELKRRGLQKSLKKSDSPKHLIHFSTTPGLTTLDPEFQGTAGRHSPETKHGKPTHPRVYFYEEGTPTESVVTGGAKSKYVVKHPGHDKIIDIANDLENQQQAKQQWLQKPIGSMQDAYFKLLKDKGYLGFKNSASGLPNVVAMFHATPVHAEIPMPKDMAANPDWTKAEIPMSLKKSDVKEAVEKIKGPAKVNEVLAEAKPDMRSKILAALRKEKLAKAKEGQKAIKVKGVTSKTQKPIEVDAIETKSGIKIPSSSWKSLNLPHDDWPVWQHNEAAGHTKFYAKKDGSFISYKNQQALMGDMQQQASAFNPSKKLEKTNGTGISGAGGATPPMMRPPVPAAPASMAMSKADESESRMAKKDLKDIMEYAQALDKMVVESEDLEDWVDSKITVARQYLSDIAHYLSYENGQPTEELGKSDKKWNKQLHADIDDLMNQGNIKEAASLMHDLFVKPKSHHLNQIVESHPDIAAKFFKDHLSPQHIDYVVQNANKPEDVIKQIGNKLKPHHIDYLAEHDPAAVAEHLSHKLNEKQIDSIVNSNVQYGGGLGHYSGKKIAEQYLSKNPIYAAKYKKSSLEKGDVIGMKTKKIISTDVKPAPKTLVAKQPTQAVYKRGTELAIDSGFKGDAGKTGGKPDLSLAKSDSKKAKFERCVLAVKKKSGDKVNPWAVCHASVDGAKKSEDLEKADMKVKEQEKPTKGMPQAKQLKADADLEKIKEGAENVAKATDKKKSELSKSGYFKEDKKTQLPKWHDPLQEQRESAAKEESELRPESKMHIWAMLEREKQQVDKDKTQKPKEELEKAISPEQQKENIKKQRKLQNKIALQVRNPLKRLEDAPCLSCDYPMGSAWKHPVCSHCLDRFESQSELANFINQKIRQESDKPTPILSNPSHLKVVKSFKNTVQNKFSDKSEELEKGKNVRKQREAVFGGWKTSAGSPRREKQIAALTDMIKRRFGLEAKRAPGKVAASGKVIDKPNFHDNVVEHIGNPDSLAHEVGHLYQYGKDMESIDPRKEFKTKEQSLSDWQKDMDTHWGDINVKHGYKKQAQTAEEYEPTALENYYRRRAGLPTHQKTASTEEQNRIESEKRGKKYKKPEIPRTHAVDDPSKEIVQKVKVKGKDGQEKEVWLTGSMKNLTNKTRELVDQIDRGELMLDPTRGFVEGTSVDAKINRRARAASKDKTRKDADTLMRSDEVLEKKLITGEGKPSKATKKATPEEHKAIMDKLSTALDTVKVDTSPEAVKERKMLLEHVKHKLKGQK